MIEIYGAREHNLKNIDVTIPRDKLTVITGLSGSGKSSLAFDTIYAEGQRRYIETLSSYARKFIGNMERPDVDRITGLSPVIAIEQKTVSRNPRSTVGTITEIYDFLRLLFARAADAYSMNTNEKMVKYTDDQIIALVEERFAGRPVYLLAPVVKGRKGHYRELFEQIRKKGFLHVRVDGEILGLKHGMKLDRYKIHFIETVVDKLVVGHENRNRLKASLTVAMKAGKGTVLLIDKDTNESRYYSRKLMCPSTGLSYDEPAPHTFSFNSPQGACPHCNGLGEVSEVDMNKIIPDPESTIRKGGIVPLGPAKNSVIFGQVEALAVKFGCTLNTPLSDFPEEALQTILYGTESPIRVKSQHGGFEYHLHFEGIISYLIQEHEENTSLRVQNWANRFIRKITCPQCKGTRLKPESLYFRLHDKNIAELAEMDISSLSRWFETVEQHLSEKQQRIAHEIIKEIRTRIGFLLDVGLYYLSLNLGARSLSGGESQRIRLATQIGSQLVNVLYILDEPSIGLHQRDNRRLIQALQRLRNLGNSVIVVEHDREMILSADYVVDMGPYAGRKGGEVIATGAPEEIIRSHSITGQYLNGRKSIDIPKTRRQGNGKILQLKGASGNNLKKISVAFPLGKFICVTGVSGSGKSTLINETLHPILSRHFYRSLQEPLPYSAIEGLEHIDKVIQVDQLPLGRTPRSNPATYTGVFSAIRDLFSHTPEAVIRNYRPGRFSFNVKGGRCDACGGAGVQAIEMNFLPSVYVPCNVCNGKRYNRETLEIKYHGKNISDVLDMTVNMAVEFFQHHPAILPHLQALQQTGLGYVKLGQSSATLSGGESQRVKLAAELAKRDTGKTFYILDEPTTGLHFDDVRALLETLQRLVDRGNTVVVIEHNLEVIKVTDYIIDIGPEGGMDGGKLVCCGTPEEVARHKKSYTAEFLRQAGL
ncbi:MAG: excinuclease ABC subunit UvrA [Bacteroidales bacterium]|jgi:excinuclease ABC subunit A|nr:excinuclease ABC subunit UvrA [Bacteroidales bacterium]